VDSVDKVFSIETEGFSTVYLDVDNFKVSTGFFILRLAT
jgi:hypothetical protein